ncbi:glycosyl hydrolase [Enterocloster clostridioformis]|uniref:beta-glucosidase family protein n=1 Tax=Enterocloster clostridioformis TaxID=1531 RepID=UPI00080C4468|nr:glycoside hydrolase family 3 C-terminal domain-containing protein [Enterocloster clostridioformis]ANU47952.1 glycosyl hydrolase [Lachnoclostridium sp. YL32]NDO29749.1 glycosyl hydrolase [Enterocloster clostridioformis]OXE69332.1 glycosyl hydrolase [Enterocloster clostridioformis]QQR03151.1 glycoside hydrolase family 3 C-terminal domain-containing protein [Enterocloster clostridioformis]
MDYSKENRLSYTERARRIVDSLTLEERVSLMSGSMTFEEVRGAIKKKTREHYNHFPYPAGGIPEKGIPAVLFCDGPRGVVCGNGKSTCFPVSMLRGASFDTDLEEEIGEVMAEEVLAYGGNLSAGVCINLPYNPGWGRSQETYGEDSFHLGEMGTALVRGIQKKGVIACVKHFAFNQMENARFKVNVDCTGRTEREVFLPHFKKCIDQGAGAVMSSYNLYKGVMCGHNGYLLDQVLKEEWGFDGFVMSDFVWGVKDTAAAANGGQTMEMCVTKYFGQNLVNAVKEGLVDASRINDAALRIVRTLLAFEDKKEHVRPNVIGCKKHTMLALESAREGITLIKNQNQVLPLDKKSIRQVVVLGRLAQKENTGDRGSSQVYPPYVVTAVKGIAAASPKTEVIYYEGSNPEHSRHLAQEADAVIFVVGYDYNDEGEYVAEDKKDVYTGAVGGDRRNGLGLHGADRKLIEAAGPANKNSIVVLIGGNMIMLEGWKDSVASILMGYYPGMEGGTALGEIIYGDVNPSGKLPFVIPNREDQLPSVDWNGTTQYYDYYHGYRKLDKEEIRPAVPYGFGLSYTTFSVECMKAWTADGLVYACCDVKNTGGREGTEVLQMYVGFPQSKVDRPVRTLKGFKRSSLQPGEKRTVVISCPAEELAWFNEEAGSFETEHMEYEIYMGTSSAPEDLLMTTITI